MLHEMNQIPDIHSLNVNNPVAPGSSFTPNNRQIDPDFSVMPDNGMIDPDFSVMPDNGMIDPDFSVMPDNGIIDPDFSVMPDNGVIDPDFSVMPDNGIIDPDFSVPPVWNPVGPGPVIPCINCLPVRSVSVRFLNASPEHSNLTIEVDNRVILTGMDFAEISRYRRHSRGYHRITVMAPNGYVFLSQRIFLGNNATISIVSINNRISLTAITDGGCATSYNNACLRICNLAYASGAVNVILSNGYLIFSNTQPGTAGSFSRMQSGTYPVSVARSARPAVTLLSTYINLNPNKVYTLYVLNWAQSSDTIRILLVEDIR